MKKSYPSPISETIRSRKSVFPAMYTSGVVDKTIIEEMLENANWAPSHRKTEPWRFKVFREEGLQKLADALSATYKNTVTVEQFSERKFTKLQQNPLKADTVIAIVLHRDPEESVPEWEEIAAVACAVQNMWLTCSSYDLGCYWSTPGIIKHLNNFLELSENEKCLGLFYVANHQAPELLRQRGSINEKTTWITT